MAGGFGLGGRSFVQARQGAERLNLESRRLDIVERGQESTRRAKQISDLRTGIDDLLGDIGEKIGKGAPVEAFIPIFEATRRQAMIAQETTGEDLLTMTDAKIQNIMATPSPAQAAITAGGSAAIEAEAQATMASDLGGPGVSLEQARQAQGIVPAPLDTESDLTALGKLQRNRAALEKRLETTTGEEKKKIQRNIKEVDNRIAKLFALAGVGPGQFRKLQLLRNRMEEQLRQETDTVKREGLERDIKEINARIKSLEERPFQALERVLLEGLDLSPDDLISGGEVSQDDLEFTAQKHGITVEEVKKRMGVE